MPTKAEQTILNRRKSSGVLVPLIERFLETECEPRTADDFRFLDMLYHARALPRQAVFSPSMLATCKRSVYFAKTGVEKHKPRDAQMNGYFLHGNAIHAKWQFVLWKMHEAGVIELATVPIGGEVDIIMRLVVDCEISEKDGREWMDALNFYGDATRPAIEVRVVDGDYGGTIDALVHVKYSDHLSAEANDYVMQPYVVDFKGINQVDFARTVRDGTKQEYRVQIVGYAKIANKVLSLDPPVEDCLLISENKSGPQSGQSPLALHESLVNVERYSGEQQRRLRALRYYDEKQIVPAAECVSTRHMAFAGCPFSRLCRDEVLKTQKESDKIAAEARRTARPALSPRRT